jgi:uncharacterized PurR-regulated membrane protein YhhQ (DUF165 family)
MKFAAGTALFGISYLITDVVNNNWGKSEARWVIVTSVSIRMLLYLALIPLVLAIPAFRAPQNYTETMQGAFRLFLAGEVSTFLTQYFMEIPFFSWLRRFWGFAGSYVGAGLLNVAVSSFLFSLVAFWGSNGLLSLIRGQCSVALLVRLSALPLALVANRYISKLR